MLGKKSQGEKPPVFKIPPRRVAADDCLIYVGRRIAGQKIVNPGEATVVHKDEWVEVLPVTNMAVFNALVEVSRLSTELQDNQGIMQLCEALSERVTDWNFTGLDGKELAKPYKNPKVLMSLSEDELIWLVNAAQGETTEERKKD